MESAIDLLRQLVTSPLVYLLLFVLTAVDAFFPMIPGEAAVITATVLATGGDPNLVAVLLSAALGAFAGDHVSYAIGRGGGARRLTRFPERSRRRATSEWARRAVQRHGGLILIAARYLPAGRTAVTLTMGAVRYPLRPFSVYDTFAALGWAIYCVLLGYFGGVAFERDPLRGVLAGLAVSLLVTLVFEVVRQVRHRAAAPR